MHAPMRKGNPARSRRVGGKVRVSRKIRVPLYIQIYEELLKSIKDCRFAQGTYLPSESAFARTYNVDRQTIRRSLDLLVAEGVVVKRAGVGTLVKDFSAPQNRNQQNNAMIFVLPRIKGSYDRLAEPFNSRLFFHIESELRQQGCSLVSLAADSPGELQRTLDTGQYRGAIFVSTLPDDVIELARERSLPAVVVGRPFPGYPCIREEAAEGVAAGIRHLHTLGHRRIGCINGIPDYVSSRERLTAYLRTLGELRLDGQEPVVRQGDWSFDSGFQAMKDVLETVDPLPTAMFACNDMMAIGAVEAIKAAGLSVPADISILGHDDIDQCRRMHPKLSTLGVDLQTMARAVCQQLVYALEKPQVDGLTTIVPTRLILRESTGPVRPERRQSAVK